MASSWILLPTSPGSLRHGLCVAPDLEDDGLLYFLSSPLFHMLFPFWLHLSLPSLSRVLQNQLAHLWRNCQSCDKNELSPSPDSHRVQDNGLVHSAESFLDSHYRRNHTYYCRWGCESEKKRYEYPKTWTKVQINPRNNGTSDKNHKEVFPGKRKADFII